MQFLMVNSGITRVQPKTEAGNPSAATSRSSQADELANGTFYSPVSRERTEAPTPHALEVFQPRLPAHLPATRGRKSAATHARCMVTNRQRGEFKGNREDRIESNNGMLAEEDFRVRTPQHVTAD